MNQVLPKTCSKCKIEKDASDFYKNKTSHDGLANWCKECHSSLNKQRTKDGFWKEHYDKYGKPNLEQKRKYYHKPENKERLKKYHREYYQKNKERSKMASHRRYLENREELIAQQKQRVATDDNYRFRKSLSNMRKQTGLTLDQIAHFYNTKFAEQKGCCAICGCHEMQLKGRLHIDHDHETNELRGLLCSDCNHAIGKLQDDAELCLKAYQYLREH